MYEWLDLTTFPGQAQIAGCICGVVFVFFVKKMDAFYKEIHMFTHFDIASQTSQGCIPFVVLHIFVLGFGVDF